MTTGNNLSPTALLSEINTNLPDNTSGKITPAILRQILADITVSYPSLNTASTITSSYTFSSQIAFGTTPYTQTDVYTGGTSNSFLVGVRGSTGTPITDQGANIVLQNVANLSSGSSTGLYISAEKQSTTANVGARGIWTEVIDNVGGSGSYVEGARFNATLGGSTTNGNATGSVLIGVSSTAAYKYVIGSEHQAYNLTATAATTTFSSSKFAAAVMATCGQGVGIACDAGFIVNPFSNSSFITGLLIPSGTTVSDTGVRIDATLNYGLDFSRATFNTAAINSPGFSLGPTGAIFSGNVGVSSGSIQLNGSVSGNSSLAVSTTGALFLASAGGGYNFLASTNSAALVLSGSSSGSVSITTPAASGGMVQFASSGSFTATGSSGTPTLTNTLPAGGHTTIQTWFTIVDSGGTTRYIPCY